MKKLIQAPLIALALVSLLSASLQLAFANWTPVELTNDELRRQGTRTGDGAQWMQTIAVDHKDGSFMLWGTDVGGVFRSLDGGKNWEPANVGFDSRGSTGSAIDPNNPDRALVIASNSVSHPFNGIYLTTNRAASWQRALGIQFSGIRDFRRQLAYDPATYDTKAKMTRTVYWATMAEDKPHWGKSLLKPGFMVSQDGGASWKRLDTAEAMAGSFIAVHPKNGTIYAAKPNDGFYRSTDKGKSWQKSLDGNSTGIAVSASTPDRVYVSFDKSLYRSDDSGTTWKRLNAASEILTTKDPKATVRNVTVAPSNANRLVMWIKAPKWHFPRYYSHDGGKTWQESKVDRSGTLVPSNERQGLFAFNPVNPNIILSTGGDYPTISTDGGKIYKRSANGVNNILVGGCFSFSVIDPNIVLLGSQDYGTLLTKDGGKNWTYFEPVKKGWGGFNYAAYSSDGVTLVVGDADEWRSPKMRTVSLDGGKTWKRSDEEIKPLTSYGDPKNKNTLFAGSYRSEDGGKSWKKMKGVNGVYTHDAKSLDLFGLKYRDGADRVTVVRSTDGGKTWGKVVNVNAKVMDIAYDYKRDKLYLPAVWEFYVYEDGKLSKMKNFQADQEGKRRMLSAAVDPVDPSVVYIAGGRNTFASNAPCFRSLDAGKTWDNLLLQEPIAEGMIDGGRESERVRVHPVTREPWFATSCYGVWKYSSPTAPKVDNTAETSDDKDGSEPNS